LVNASPTAGRRKLHQNPDPAFRSNRITLKGRIFSTLEAICEALHCQPGDILEYDPDAIEKKESRNE
jgi:hypothetical protein